MTRALASLALAAALAAAAPALAYVPPAPRIVELWSAAYAKAGNLQLAGTLEQGSARVPFQVSLGADGVVYEEAGRPVSDVTSRLVFTLLLDPAAAATWLQGLGLDPAATGLARDGKRIDYTLGAAGERRPGTQVWLDRELAVPRSARIVRPTLTQTIEFVDYETSASRIIPRLIRVTVDGVVRTYRIEKVAPKK